MQQVTSYIPTNFKSSKKASRKTYFATIGSKYQIVIPKEIRQEMNIKPGQKLYVDASGDGTINLIVPPKNWSDQNFGALKKDWQGINMTGEVERIRNESET